MTEPINTTSLCFGVGDWVVALKSTGTQFTQGKLYRVKSFGRHLMVEKDDLGSTTNGWTSENFQKVRFLGEWDGEGALPKYVLRPTYKDPNGVACRAQPTKALTFSRKERLSCDYVKDRAWWWRSGKTKKHEINKDECSYESPNGESVEYKEPLMLSWTHPDFQSGTTIVEPTPTPEEVLPPVVQAPLQSGLRTMESDFYFLILNEDKFFDT